MQENCTSGTVSGALGNWGSYGERSIMRRSYHESRETEFDGLIKIANDAVLEIKEAFG